MDEGGWQPRKPPRYHSWITAALITLLLGGCVATCLYTCSPRFAEVRIDGDTLVAYPNSGIGDPPLPTFHRAYLVELGDKDLKIKHRHFTAAGLDAILSNSNARLLAESKVDYSGTEYTGWVRPVLFDLTKISVEGSKHYSLIGFKMQEDGSVYIEDYRDITKLIRHYQNRQPAAVSPAT